MTANLTRCTEGEEAFCVEDQLTLDEICQTSSVCGTEWMCVADDPCYLAARCCC